MPLPTSHCYACRCLLPLPSFLPTLLHPQPAGAGSTDQPADLLLLVLALCGRGATGLDADGELLMAFRRAVTADPLGALRGWSYSDDSACAWNGVICNGFPQPQQASTVNLTSVSAADGSGSGNGNFSTLAGGRANGTLLGLNASMAAATVSRVIGLVLPGAQLSGSLPAELARVEHLRHLDLSGNGLNGTLPAALLLNATELRVLSLAGNDLSGALPDASYARGLQELNLSDNALAGWLPASLLRAPGLAVLGLANNYLAGELPAGGLGGLEVVDLSNNYFRGALPADFGGTQLRFLNVSSNSLTGALPADLSDVVPANTSVDLSNNNFTGAVPPAGPFAAQPASAYEGNPGLCGPPLKHACSIPSSLSNPPNATDSPPAFAAIPKSAARAPPGSPEAQAPRGGQGKLKPLVILAIVAGDLAGVGLLFMLFMYVYHIRKKRRQRREENPTAPQHKGIGGGAKALSVAGAKEEKTSTSIGCCIGGGKNDGSDSSDCSASSSDAASDDGGGEDTKKRAGSYIGWGTPQHHSKNKHEQQQQAPAPATLVTVDGGDGELEMETLLKASAYILGATGSSIVYKAVLADGTALAVRRIGESGGADKLKDFEAQVRAVARFRHPNILRLRGFYWGADEKLLIHDYAANGSLANVAFTRRFGAASPMHLNLEARLRIARGVARGLAFIHDKKGVHGNVKPSNILLGADMEPLVGDLGLDRLLSGEAAAGRGGGGGASARLFGSKRSMHSTSSLPDLSQMPGGAGPGASPAASAPPPYQAPECLKSLRPNAKWDVYSFGMVLLELLSGRVYSEVELCQWHAGAVDVQRGRVLRMADPTLRGEAADAGGEDALLGCFRLAFACCAMAPGKRPAMRDAAALLDRIQPTPSSASSAIETPPY
ncbi:unnamed protein product [Triticum turgidum subsp. durum]|uniref:Protein kinase domain-containing protein n=1 Tax=Triticum turgidum subsp. durum TaxID=4567 RepID=A0A9R1ADQ5_TRITD|nr:unnamed protein product [Triticum turgidum subsp. durum]